MRFEIAPALDRLFVTPDREREDLGLVGEAGEALDRDEAVHLLQLGLQAGGEIEVVLLPAGRGYDLEDDGDHGFKPMRPFSAPALACAWAMARVTYPWEIAS